MIHLHLNFMDCGESGLNTPFILLRDFPLLPRIGDTFAIDIEEDGIQQFAQGYDLHTFEDYRGFFECFRTNRFKVAAVEMRSNLKAPMDPISDSIGLVLQGRFDRETYPGFVKRTFGPERARMFLEKKSDF